MQVTYGLRRNHAPRAGGARKHPGRLRAFRDVAHEKGSRLGRYSCLPRAARGCAGPFFALIFADIASENDGPGHVQFVKVDVQPHAAGVQFRAHRAVADEDAFFQSMKEIGVCHGQIIV